MSQPSPFVVALASGVLDRGSQSRPAPDLDQAWHEPDALVLPLHSGRMSVAGSQTSHSGQVGAGVVLRGMPARSASPQWQAASLWLGRNGKGAALFAVELNEADMDRVDPTLTPLGSPAGRWQGWAGLREVVSALPPWQQEAFVTAVALNNWHRTHQRCPRCGEATVVRRGGWMRQCPADGSEHYPRTDPAVIVLLRDPSDRALLARADKWPPGWMSTLAGFVEPGESLESAVVREVGEEVGLEVTDPVYLGSQPWPFPASLMLGFHASAPAEEPHPDGTEIAEARWFTREQLATEAERGHVRLPPRASIARSLIEHWYGQPLPGSWSRPRPDGSP